MTLPEDYRCRIWFHNVGGWNCAVVHVRQCGSKNRGVIGIIDCGVRDGVEIDNKLLTSSKKLDFVAITHLHEDHFFGISHLLSPFEGDAKKLGNVYWYAVPQTYVEQMLNGTTLAEDARRAYEIVLSKSRNRLYSFSGPGPLSNFPGDCLGVSAKWVSPLGNEHAKFTSLISAGRNKEARAYQNNVSGALLLEISITDHEPVRVLFGGDASEDKIFRIASDVPKVDLYCVSHHGSPDVHSEQFWSKLITKDTAVIISAPGNERPSLKVVGRAIESSGSIACTCTSRWCRNLSAPSKVALGDAHFESVSYPLACMGNIEMTLSSDGKWTMNSTGASGCALRNAYAENSERRSRKDRKKGWFEVVWENKKCYVALDRGNDGLFCVADKNIPEIGTEAKVTIDDVMNGHVDERHGETRWRRNNFAPQYPTLAGFGVKLK